MSSFPQPAKSSSDDSALQQRIDALIAMAYFAGQEPLLSELSDFSHLSADEESCWASRADWTMQLSPPERQRWMEATLGLRHRTTSDEEISAWLEQIHPLRWFPLLKDESALIQAGLVRLLPADVAGTLRRGLQLPAEEVGAQPAATAIDPDLRRVLLQPFLGQFIALTEVPDSTELDHLSREQLPQFVRERGLREVAIACRGLTEMETLSAFLRRFAPTDATAIGRQIQGLKWLSPERVEIAQTMLEPYLTTGFDSTLLINQVGVEMWAVALADSSVARVQYALQRIGPRTAAFLSQRITFWEASPAASLARKTIAETEELALQLRLAAGRHTTEKAL